MRFDTPGPDHYDTAPMPMAPVQPLDLQRLASAKPVLAHTFELSEFGRLADRLADTHGAVSAELALGVEEGVVVGDLRVQADVGLTCQRCLGMLRQRLESQSRLAFVAADRPVPGGREAIIGDPRRVLLAPLVEDELLLALPLIARHDSAADCGAPAADETPAAEAPTATRRPFAQLKELLKD